MTVRISNKNSQPFEEEIVKILIENNFELSESRISFSDFLIEDEIKLNNLHYKLGGLKF
jgi:hypothetical protein